MSWRSDNRGFVLRTGSSGAQLITAVQDALLNNQSLTIPPGLYTIDEPIVIAVANSFVTNLTIRGAVPAYPGLLTNSRIQTSYNDGPAFVIQGGRAIHLENLEIIGQNEFVSALSGIDDVVDEAQMLVGGARNNRYSPHCGVVIDPFINGNPGGDANNRYPSLTSYYTSTYEFISGGGNFLNNCCFRNFPVGVMNGPSGVLQGGDNFHMRHCYFQGCRIGYAVGNHQAKECTWDNSHMLYGLHAIDCVTYGLRQGYPPEVRGSLSGWTKLAYNIHHSIGPTAWGGGGFGCEATHGLGYFGFGAATGPNTVVISGREISLWNALSAKSIDVHLATFRPTIFTGCYFNMNDSTGPPGGGAGTFRIHNSNLERLVFDHCTFGMDAPNGHLPLDFNWAPTVEMRNCKNRSTDLNGVGSLSEVQVGGPGDLTFLSSGKAQFTAFSGASSVDVGDHIRISAQYQPKQYAPSGVGFNTATSVGTVIAKNGDIITLGQVPETIESLLPIVGTSFFRRRFTFA